MNMRWIKEEAVSQKLLATSDKKLPEEKYILLFLAVCS